jgi:hypothetical protein
MKIRGFYLVVLFALFRFIFVNACIAQDQTVTPIHPHHSHAPNSPLNDAQLIIPPDQAQYCYAPQSSMTGYEEFQTYDAFSLPASRGYLCLAIPQGKIFVIDYLMAEADYDSAPTVNPEWYLDTILGGNETQTGLSAARVGSSTANPHYLLSQPIHIAVAGGTRVTLIMHSFFVNANSSIVETPGTASLVVMGHWE